MLEHAAGVPACLPALLEAFHVRVQPVHHVRAWPATRQPGLARPARPGPPGRPLTNDSIGNGDLEPHPVADLQAGVWQLHDPDHGAHVALHRQRPLLQLCKARPLLSRQQACGGLRTDSPASCGLSEAGWLWATHCSTDPTPPRAHRRCGSALPAPTSWAGPASGRRADGLHAHTSLSLRPPQPPTGRTPGAGRAPPGTSAPTKEGSWGRAHTRWHWARPRGPGSSTQAWAAGPRCDHAGERLGPLTRELPLTRRAGHRAGQ